MEFFPQALIYVFQLLALLGGLVLGYLAAFTYENEDGEIQDKLAKWWIELDDLKTEKVKRQVAFIERVSETCSTWFDVVFGERLFSKRAVAVSMCVSLGTFMILGSVFILLLELVGITYHLSSQYKNDLLLGLLFIPLVGLLLFWLAIAPARGKAPPIKTMYVICSVLGLLILGSITTAQSTIALMLFPGVALGLALGIVTDLLSIAITRRVLRSRLRESPAKYFALLVGSLAVVAAIAGGLPFGLIGLSHAGFAGAGGQLSRTGDLQLLLIWLMLPGSIALASNLPSFLSVLAFFLVAAGFLLGRMLWPTLSRVVYAGHRYRIVEKKTVLWSMSGALLVAGIGPVAHWSLFTSVIEVLSVAP